MDKDHSEKFKRGSSFEMIGHFVPFPQQDDK